jgi:hypothetical protein
VVAASSLRRLGGSADLRYWVVRDLADAIRATPTMRSPSWVSTPAPN